MSLILSGSEGLSDVDGTAATPAIRGTDTNTGIFFPAADTIAFAEGGAEVARFDSSGFFLVNTTTAGLSNSRSMVFQGTGDGSLYLNHSTLNTNGDPYVHFGYNGTRIGSISQFGTTGINLASGADMLFTTNSTERMRIDTSGNLGVGTSSPSTYGRVVSSGGTFSLVTDTASQRRLSFWSTANGNSENAYIQVQNDGGTTNTGEMLFATRNAGGTLAERARITADGNFLVGTTTPTPAGIAQQGNITVITASGKNGINVATIGPGNAIQFANTNFGQTGNIAVGASTTAYNTSSDYRLKHDIAPMTGALAKVAALKPCTYKWNVDGSDGEGFIAHELAEVCPDAVTGEKDAVGADGNPKYQGIDTSFLVATLTAAIQELKAELDAVKTELAALKGTA